MTAAHRPTTPPDHIRWPLWWLWLLLYPFVALAAWIDLFMIGLVWKEWRALKPAAA